MLLDNKNYMITTNENCPKLKNFIIIELPLNIILFYSNFVRTSSVDRG